MSLVWDQRLTPATECPTQARLPEESSLNVVVIFTSTEATIAALKRAGTMAENLGANVTLVVPQVVPYPLPLTSPPILLDFQERRFCEIASKSPIALRVRLYLCRDELETLKSVLTPHSLIVMGGRRRFWPTRESRLARKLQAGHEVIFTEVG